MSWILPAIASSLTWGVVNIADKHLIDKKINQPLVYVIWLGLFGGLSVVLIPFVNFYWLDGGAVALIFVAAIFELLASFCYIKAISLEEVSRINILWQLIPVFTFLAAWLFFGEILNQKELLAFAIFLLGGVVASLHFNGGGFSFSKAFIWMFMACILFAGFAIIFDRLVITISPYLLFIYSNVIGAALSAVALLFFQKQNQAQRAHTGFGLLAVIALISILNNLAQLFNFYALRVGPIALVSVLAVAQLVFVFTVSVFLTKFFPKIIQEKIDLGNLFLKFLALICVVAGILILSYN